VPFRGNSPVSHFKIRHSLLDTLGQLPVKSRAKWQNVHGELNASRRKGPTLPRHWEESAALGP
jgi:hypothetical protein